MTKEYKCLKCKHLVPRYDLMECNLQVVRYTREDESQWTFDAVCIHDALNDSCKYELVTHYKQDVSNYDAEHNLTDRLEAE
jgi:hypothetical protein